MKKLTKEQKHYNKKVKRTFEEELEMQLKKPMAWCGFCCAITKRDKTGRCLRCQ